MNTSTNAYMGWTDIGMTKGGGNPDIFSLYIFLVMITPYTSFNSFPVSTIVPISLLASCFLYLTRTSVFLPTVVLALLNHISDSPLYWDIKLFLFICVVF